MLSHLAHYFFSTFSGLLRSRQAVSGLLLMAAGTVALLWLRVDASVVVVGLLALVAWRWGRLSLLRKSGQLVLLWLAYPAAILWLLKMLNASGGRRTEQSVVLAYSVLGLALLTTIIIKRKNTVPKNPAGRTIGAGGNVSLKFSDVGGLEDTKVEIGKLVQSRLDAKRYRKYGVVQNGILLHGPRGSGKTLLAEATAGQFGLHYEYVSPTSLKDMWVGATEGNIRRLFENAAAKCPVLLFIDEMDGLGAARQVASDPGGGRKASNDAVVQLMQCIDQYRSLPGFVLMAATNLLESLDSALIREGRFDLKIRVDLPDETARRKILESLLSGKPSKVSDMRWLAARTPGFSAAKLRTVVDRAAVMAAESRRKIEEQDLRAALDAMGGKDRPQLEPVQWRDIVIDSETEQELRELIGLLNDPDSWRQWKIYPPTGVVLVGPPGTGKSLLARLIATQTRRSFYTIVASEILGGQVGESVKKLSGVFERARDNRPSIIFFDEMDGLLPSRDGALLNQHDVQLVEQCLIEISNLSPQNDVFLIATTNHLDQIDPRVLRGGRFSEKIRIWLPSMELRQRLFEHFLQGLPLAPDASLAELAKLSEGLSHADIQAVCVAAKRFARRRTQDGQKTALKAEDFHKAIERIRVSNIPFSHKTAATRGG